MLADIRGLVHFIFNALKKRLRQPFSKASKLKPSPSKGTQVAHKQHKTLKAERATHFCKFFSTSHQFHKMRRCGNAEIQVPSLTKQGQKVAQRNQRPRSDPWWWEMAANPPQWEKTHKKILSSTRCTVGKDSTANFLVLTCMWPNKVYKMMCQRDSTDKWVWRPSVRRSPPAKKYQLVPGFRHQIKHLTFQIILCVKKGHPDRATIKISNTLLVEIFQWAFRYIIHFQKWK